MRCAHRIKFKMLAGRENKITLPK